MCEGRSGGCGVCPGWGRVCVPHPLGDLPQRLAALESLWAGSTAAGEVNGPAVPHAMPDAKCLPTPWVRAFLPSASWGRRGWWPGKPRLLAHIVQGWSRVGAATTVAYCSGGAGGGAQAAHRGNATPSPQGSRAQAGMAQAGMEAYGGVTGPRCNTVRGRALVTG